MIEVITYEKRRYSHAKLFICPLYTHGPPVSFAQNTLKYSAKVYTSPVILINHVRYYCINQPPHDIIMNNPKINKVIYV